MLQSRRPFRGKGQRRRRLSRRAPRCSRRNPLVIPHRRSVCPSRAAPRRLRTHQGPKLSSMGQRRHRPKPQHTARPSGLRRVSERCTCPGTNRDTFRGWWRALQDVIAYGRARCMNPTMAVPYVVLLRGVVRRRNHPSRMSVDGSWCTSLTRI
jgi:hypothetical protein